MPEEFGRYELHELLGRGGMGEVYRAYDTVRDRVVALKLLPKHLAQDESFKTRFRRESRMAARLNEPHIIPIHDFGEIDGTLFIDMRLVEGQDLGTLLTEKGTLPVETAVSVIGQVAAALDAAHASGLVHRDVKPSNVLLTGITPEDDSNPFAYLVDFGIARSSTQEGTALTATSGTIGTVAYMSPERIGGEHGDRRTDIYALACVLYEALTGRKPFDGELFAIMFAHVNTPPPAVTALRPDAPAALDEVVRKGMAKDPDHRYASAGALATAARSAVRSGGGGRAVPTLPPPSPPPPSGPLPHSGPQSLPVPPLVGPRAPGPQSGPTPGVHSGPTPGVHSGPMPPPGPMQWSPPPGPGPVRTGPPVTPPPHHRQPPPGPQPPPHQAGSSWTAPPPTPSGPVRLTGPAPSAPAGSKRTPLLIAAAVVVVAVVAIILAVSLGGGGGSPSANGSSQPNNSSSHVQTGTNGPNPSGSVTINTGPGGNTPTWAHFASFSKFIGSKDHDTAHTFKGGSCALEGPEQNDIPGISDQVKCSYSSSPVIVYVARFTGAAAVNSYVDKLLDTAGYSATPWSQGGQARGITFTSPSTASSIDITTRLCALPNYLMQFFVKDSSTLSASTLHDNWWDAATFPDVMPPACAANFLGAADGSTATPSIGPQKTPFVIDGSTLAALLDRDNPDLSAVVVAMPNHNDETMVVGQSGTVTFWSYDTTKDVLTKVGSSTYPFDASLGPPDAKGRGTVLNGMTHATFIVTGNFTGDGSGNAVSYTTGPHGWGAIKAQSDGNLAPSGKGVSQPGQIGLGNAFSFQNGDLVTYDCSRLSSIPISECGGQNRVIKVWAFESDGEFHEVSHSGLPR